MEGTESPVVSDTTSTHAATAAASASGAESAAVVAEVAAVNAEHAAENASAAVEQVSEQIAETGEHIAEVAANVSEAAVSAAVETIQSEIEAENTWMANQIAEIRRDIANHQALTADQTGQILSRLQTMEQFLQSNLRPSQPAAAEPENGNAGGQQEVPTVAKEKPQKKNRMI